jgi:hypothetical protein
VEGCRYRLNRRDLLVFVDEGWARFAREAGADELLPPGVLNRSIWEFVTDPRLRLLQAELLRKTRSTRKPIRLPFHCDSPNLRRWMEMELQSAAGGEVTVTTTLVWEDARPPVAFLDARPPGLQGPLEELGICGWCNSVQYEDGPWQSVEALLRARPGWPEAGANVEVHHRLCPGCDTTLAAAAS